jgi:hypothetical protein
MSSSHVLKVSGIIGAMPALMTRPAAGLLLLGSTAAWGERLPTAIEFRTAYCIPMIKWTFQQLDDQQRILKDELRTRRPKGLPARCAGIPDDSLQAALKVSQERSASERSALHRLQAYFTPLIPDLDPSALRAAAQRATADR